MVISEEVDSGNCLSVTLDLLWGLQQPHTANSSVLEDKVLADMISKALTLPTKLL